WMRNIDKTSNLQALSSMAVFRKFIRTHGFVFFPPAGRRSGSLWRRQWLAEHRWLYPTLARFEKSLRTSEQASSSTQKIRKSLPSASVMCSAIRDWLIGSARMPARVPESVSCHWQSRDRRSQCMRRSYDLGRRMDRPRRVELIVETIEQAYAPEVIEAGI